MANNDRSSNSSTSAPAASSTLGSTAGMTTDQKLELALAALAESQQKMVALMEQQAEYNKSALKIAPRRKKSMAEYLNERRKRGGGKFLPHQVFQNGREVNPSGLSEETIKTLDRLATGHYCDGLVDVVRISDGHKGINSRIHIRYNNGNDMERMQFYMRFPTFTKLVNDIAAEMKARGIEQVIEPGQEAPQYEFPENL